MAYRAISRNKGALLHLNKNKLQQKDSIPIERKKESVYIKKKRNGAHYKEPVFSPIFFLF
jgi:hypothetical protein